MSDTVEHVFEEQNEKEKFSHLISLLKHQQIARRSEAKALIYAGREVFYPYFLEALKEDWLLVKHLPELLVWVKENKLEVLENFKGQLNEQKQKELEDLLEKESSISKQIISIDPKKINFVSFFYPSILFWVMMVVVLVVTHPYIKDNPLYLKWFYGILTLTVLFFSVVIHELAHGFLALKGGDYTAYSQGRLSLSPFPHISLFGTIILPLVLYHLVKIPFGWAKPVPINVSVFKNPRWGQFLVSFFGPASNLALAHLFLFSWIFIGFVMRVFYPEMSSTGFNFGISFTSIRPSLDPVSFSNVSFVSFWVVLTEICKIGFIINLILAAVNLIPIPPLDGSWVLLTLLPSSWHLTFHKFRLVGLIILVFLIFSQKLQFLLLPFFIFIWLAASFVGTATGLY